jgi:hypothetical protein
VWGTDEHGDDRFGKENENQWREIQRRIEVKWM